MTCPGSTWNDIAIELDRMRLALERLKELMKSIRESCEDISETASRHGGNK